MQITLLGTGTPMLDPSRQGSALLIEVGGDKLLFDAGRGVTSQLAKTNISPQAINPIFITHHHHDHIGNLGELLMAAWYNGRQTPLDLYGPPGTAEIVTALFEQVYARDIAFTLFSENSLVDIKALVQVHEISPGLICDFPEWQVFAEYVDHGNGMGLSHETWPCFGYRLEAEGKTIAISGDTVACDGLDRLAHKADVLIQCCYLAEAEITNPALERLARYVIASSGQVGQIAARNEVKKLILTHIRPKAPELMQSMLADVRRDYAGEVQVAEDLLVVEV